MKIVMMISITITPYSNNVEDIKDEYVSKYSNYSVQVSFQR